MEQWHAGVRAAAADRSGRMEEKDNKMKNKRILLIAAVAVVVTVVAYFAVGNLRMGNVEDDPLHLDEGFGIAEAAVEFVNVYPGWVGSAPLTIINGDDEARVFWVSCEQPTAAKIKEGYEALPEPYFSWITITGWNGTAETVEPEVVLAAGEYHQLTLVLAMPEDVEYYGKRAEVRIRVSDLNPVGIVTIAVESKWFILTADEEAISE